MRIGILLADRVLPEYRAAFGDYQSMFAATLGAAGVVFDGFDVQAGRYPQRLADCDGYVITGSRFSVYDKDAWVVRLAAFVRELHRARTPTVGICFGHQMIAHALGGETTRATGWGVGVHAWDVLSQEPWMRPPLPRLRLLASHQDQVRALPPGARPLATSAFCRHAGFTLGDHMLAWQGHPEFPKGYAAALMRSRQAILGDAFKPGLRSLRQATDEGVVAGWIVRFLRWSKEKRATPSG